MNKEIFELMEIFEKAKNKFLKEEKEIIKIDVMKELYQQD